MIYILNQFHALDYMAAAVRALALDKGKRTAWTETMLNVGRVACIITALKPHRDRMKPTRHASSISKPTRTECAPTAAGSAYCRSDPASWKAHAS